MYFKKLKRKRLKRRIKWRNDKISITRVSRAYARSPMVPAQLSIRLSQFSFADYRSRVTSFSFVNVIWYRRNAVRSKVSLGSSKPAYSYTHGRKQSKYTTYERRAALNVAGDNRGLRCLADELPGVGHCNVKTNEIVEIKQSCNSAV